MIEANENSKTEGADAEKSPEMVRREFIKRFGKYAVGSAVGVYLLMSPTTAKRACASTPSDSGGL